MVNQLECKKLAIQNMIKKHHNDLKILQDTIDNIKDEKKLADWVEDFQRNEQSKAKALDYAKQQQQQEQPNAQSSSIGLKQCEIKQELKDSYQPAIIIQDLNKRTNLTNIQQPQQQQQAQSSFQPTFYIGQAPNAWNTTSNVNQEQLKLRASRTVSDSGLIVNANTHNITNNSNNINNAGGSHLNFQENPVQLFHTSNSFSLPNDFNLDMENLNNLNPDIFDRYFKNLNS